MIKPAITLFLLLCALCWTCPNRAQAQWTPQRFDSAAIQVMAQARVSANAAEINNYFLVSAATALPAGYLGLFVLDSGRAHWIDVVVAASGLGVFALFVQANKSATSPPDSLLRGIPEDLRDEYSKAYRTRIESRQSSGVMGGAAVGIMTGIAILFMSIPRT